VPHTLLIARNSCMATIEWLLQAYLSLGTKMENLRYSSCRGKVRSVPSDMFARQTRQRLLIYIKSYGCPETSWSICCHRCQKPRLRASASRRVLYTSLIRRYNHQESTSITRFYSFRRCENTSFSYKRWTINWQQSNKTANSRSLYLCQLLTPLCNSTLHRVLWLPRDC